MCNIANMYSVYVVIYRVFITLVHFSALWIIRPSGSALSSKFLALSFLFSPLSGFGLTDPTPIVDSHNFKICFFSVHLAALATIPPQMSETRRRRSRRQARQARPVRWARNPSRRSARVASKNVRNRRNRRKMRFQRKRNRPRLLVNRAKINWKINWRNTWTKREREGRNSKMQQEDRRKKHSKREMHVPT